jgi:serine acetyltransferase
MPHLSGVVIDGVIGEGATIYANCVIAGLRTERPIAGDHLTLGGHAGLIGPIRAGDGVRLAPKVQLTSNAPAGAQAYSPMSRVKRLGPGEYVPPTPHRHVRPPQEDPWKEWRRCRRSDRERLRKCFPAAPFAARSSVALFRLSCALRQSGYRRASRWLWRANMYLTGSDLASDSVIGAGLVVPYPAGISLFATTGENLTLHAQTMLVPEVDAPGARDRANAPTLGSDVTLEPHSGVCGPSTVGDNVTIRPGCVVRFAVESGRTVSPKPLRLRVAPVAAASPKR